MPNTWKNFELDVDQMFLVILCMADMMRGAANSMSRCGRRTECEVGQNQSQNNKFLLNEYLGIFIHFESIFFIFLNLENGLFQTHPPTKFGKFQIFLNSSLNKLFSYEKLNLNFIDKIFSSVYTMFS